MLQIVSKFLKPLSFLGPPFPYLDLPRAFSGPRPLISCEPQMAFPCLTKPINVSCFKSLLALRHSIYKNTENNVSIFFFFLKCVKSFTVITEYKNIFDQHLVHVQCKYTKTSPGESGMESSGLRYIFSNLFS